jgi:hypothetical protein
MFAWLNDKKTIDNTTPLFIASEQNDSTLKNSYGVMATSFTLKGTHTLLNPTNNMLMSQQFSDGGQSYTFSSNDIWVVESIKKDYRTVPYTEYGEAQRLDNLIGVNNPKYSVKKNLIVLSNLKQYSLNAGIVNNSKIFRIPIKSNVQCVKKITLPWDTFLESIESYQQPPSNVHLPSGTILYVKPLEEIENELNNDIVMDWNHNMFFRTTTKQKKGRWDSAFGNTNLVVVKTPYQQQMGFVGKRNTASIFPTYDRLTLKVQRRGAKKEPYEVQHIYYNTEYQPFSYSFALTLKGNTSALRSKDVYMPASFQSPSMLHHCIKMGYITVVGRYGGKRELKNKWDKEVGKSYTSRVLFDYSNPVPSIETLSPSL